MSWLAALLRLCHSSLPSPKSKHRHQTGRLCHYFGISCLAQGLATGEGRKSALSSSISGAPLRSNASRTLLLCQGAYIVLILARFNMNGANSLLTAWRRQHSRRVQRLESPRNVTIATHLDIASCPNFAVCIGKLHTVPYGVWSRQPVIY
ncbi:hypothetical protein EDB86DRAFT_2328132 [Lactarius hatsudake]|nr:hypothetical protein EDB86DRAFT_2328132 [Lactarius hatsudake]